ncbi:MAG TPA: FAD-binding oxidoreductase [Myxococcota bacterium]|nr:FAD-binding oxidoreductase [Myxococcota bacterium]
MSGIADRLRAALGARVHTDPETLAAHRRDYWARAEIADLTGHGPPPPAAVVRPESTEQVATVLRLCRDARVPVVPFGGGSGVCGGVESRPEVVVLSTRALDGLVTLDSRELRASFRAGTMGGDAERRVASEGLTIGHWPQSVELSTVGGWVATRAAGQFSTRYGSIEDLVLALEVVLPDGRILRSAETPRAAAGPDLRQWFMGSEGTLGVVTEVTFSLRPQPESRRLAAFHFPTLESGLEAIRRFIRVGWQPPVVRLYDERESRRQFAAQCPEGRCLLLLVHEGPTGAVTAEAAGVDALCRAEQGEPADPKAVEHWLEHRNQVPSFRELLERGLVVDTIEVAATWDRVSGLYRAVVASLRELPEVALASAHSSHSYRSGTNLYFTFAARVEDRTRMAAIYDECWRRTMRATHAAGGGIAHHHGIGRVRRAYLRDEIGDVGVALLRALKRSLDPDDLLNPGVLLPEPAANAP